MLEDSSQELSISNESKVHNAAFSGVIACTSNFRLEERKKLEKIFRYMNGRIADKMDSTVTVLITNSTKTIKYGEAMKNKIPCFHDTWISSIWERSQRENEHFLEATAPQFDVFRLPALFNLKITCTGIAKDKKNQLQTLIEENGGNYKETFSTDETDILIMDEKDKTNNKFRYAIKFKIPVLESSWIEASVMRGYSLPYEDYCFKALNFHGVVGTALIDSQEMSSIMLQETEKITSPTIADAPTLEKDEVETEVASNHNHHVLADITNDDSSEKFLKTFPLQTAKKIGNIFDGFSFYLHNFSFDMFQKVGKIINTCAGTRIGDLDDQVNYILTMSSDTANLRGQMKQKDIHAIIVHYNWFVECLKQSKLVPENDFIISDNSSAIKLNQPVPPSPMSKKAMRLLHIQESKSVGSFGSSREIQP